MMKQDQPQVVKSSAESGAREQPPADLSTDDIQQTLHELRVRQIEFEMLTANSAILRWRRDGTITCVNEYALRFFDYRADELLGKHVDILLPQPVFDSDDSVGNLGRLEKSTHENVLRDGTRVWMTWIHTPIRDEQGRITEILAVGSDDTARIQAETELRANRERLDLALMSSKMATFDWDIVADRRIWSDGVHLLIGTRPDTFTGAADGFFQAVHPDDRDSVRLALIRAVESDGNDYEHEFRVVWPDGSIHHIHSRGRIQRDSAQHAVRLIGISWDITARKQAEDMRRLQAVAMKSAANAIVIVGCDGNIQWVNDAFMRLTGYETAEVIGRNIRMLASGRHPAEFYAGLWNTVVAGHVWSGEMVNRRKDGMLYMEEMTITPVTSATGEITHFVAIKQDVTERKAAEEALRQSEKIARSQWAEAEATLEALPANIALLDDRGTIIRVNRAWIAFARENGGLDRSSAVGGNYLTVCDRATGAEAGDAECFSTGIRKVIEGTCGAFSMEYSCHSPEQQRWFMGYVSAARGDSNARVVVAHVDITAQKVIEEQIRALNQNLEHRVLDRTAELQNAVRALESEITLRQRLEREILEISEREQSRLGQDLHDGLGQELAGTAMLGDVLARKLQSESHPLAAAAAKVADYIRSIIDSTRRLAKGLYPVDLNRYGLLVALKDLADQTSQRTGISCELRQSGEGPQLANSTEIHIYRIVQECVGNAVKHGRPRHIIIEALAVGDSHTFTVTNDGVGYEQPAANRIGMGLHLMEYRARVIGARFTIEQPEHGGCRVVLRLSDKQGQEEN